MTIVHTLRKFVVNNPYCISTSNSPYKQGPKIREKKFKETSNSSWFCKYVCQTWDSIKSRFLSRLPDRPVLPPRGFSWVRAICVQLVAETAIDILNCQCLLRVYRDRVITSWGIMPFVLGINLEYIAFLVVNYDNWIGIAVSMNFEIQLVACSLLEEGEVKDWSF